MKQLHSAQEAIDEAIEGGYPKSKTVTPSLLFERRDGEPLSIELFDEINRRFQKGFIEPSVLTDPLFWKSLSKARGWMTDDEIEWIIPSTMSRRDALIEVEERLGVSIKEMDDRIVYLPYTNGKKTYKAYMHDWIENRILGGDEKTFWEQLP